MEDIYLFTCRRCFNTHPDFGWEDGLEFQMYCFICQRELKDIWYIKFNNDKQVEDIISINDTKDKKLWTLGARANRKCCNCDQRISNLCDGVFDFRNFHIFAPHPYHILCKQCFSEKFETINKCDATGCGLEFFYSVKIPGVDEE